MSQSSSPISTPLSGLSSLSVDHLTHNLAALVADIERTRDWFVAQMDAQVASLHQLQASMQVDDSASGDIVAGLFEAPSPEIEIMPPEAPRSSQELRHTHQAIVLPPTVITALDPELEQATLHELNNALVRAFSEISSRGGMLS